MQVSTGSRKAQRYQAEYDRLEALRMETGPFFSCLPYPPACAATSYSNVHGLNVQHWLADEPDDPIGTTYKPVVCQACTKLHFINFSTGKLLANLLLSNLPRGVGGRSDIGSRVWHFGK